MIRLDRTWAEEWPAICRRFRWPAWEPAHVVTYLMMRDIGELLEFVALLDVTAALTSQGELPHPERVMATRNYRDHLRSLTQLAEAAGIVPVPLGWGAEV